MVHLVEGINTVLYNKNQTSEGDGEVGGLTKYVIVFIWKYKRDPMFI